MSIQAVKAYFEKQGRLADVREFNESSATVEQAAQVLQVIPARIAKTLSFHDAEHGAMLLVAAGDAKIDNSRFKQQFGFKAKMLDVETVATLTGHPVGGVCPFALTSALPVFLDVSLKRFTTIFPACGSANSAIELTCDELEQYAMTTTWVNVCKAWNESEG